MTRMHDGESDSTIFNKTAPPGRVTRGRAKRERPNRRADSEGLAFTGEALSESLALDRLKHQRLRAGVEPFQEPNAPLPSDIPIETEQAFLARRASSFESSARSLVRFERQTADRRYGKDRKATGADPRAASLNWWEQPPSLAPDPDIPAPGLAMGETAAETEEAVARVVEMLRQKDFEGADNFLCFLVAPVFRSAYPTYEPPADAAERKQHIERALNVLAVTILAEVKNPYPTRSVKWAASRIATKIPRELLDQQLKEIASSRDCLTKADLVEQVVRETAGWSTRAASDEYKRRTGERCYPMKILRLREKLLVGSSLRAQAL